MRIVRWLAGALAITFMTAASAAPLTPIKPWNVHYEPASCSAQRQYGDPANPIYLALVPSAWGDTFELLIAANGVGPGSAEELKGSVDFGQGPIKAWLLHYGKHNPPLNFYKFRISKTQMAQAKSARTVTFHLEDHPDFSFTLDVIPQLLTKLDECTTDLQHFWNMAPADKNVAAPPIGDVRTAFRASDYPEEAMSHDQEGQAQFLLLVDENGKVAACDVLHPSGIPALDGMGCQVILERAKFKPAIGRDGKPVRSSFVTPPVVWRFND